MLHKEDIDAILEQMEEIQAVLDEEQRKIDNYRKVRKTDTKFQASLVKRQDELNFVRGELAKRMSNLRNNSPA